MKWRDLSFNNETYKKKNEFYFVVEICIFSGTKLKMPMSMLRLCYHFKFDKNLIFFFNCHTFLILPV